MFVYLRPDKLLHWRNLQKRFVRVCEFSQFSIPHLQKHLGLDCSTIFSVELTGRLCCIFETHALPINFPDQTAIKCPRYFQHGGLWLANRDLENGPFTSWFIACFWRREIPVACFAHGLRLNFIISPTLCISLFAFDSYSFSFFLAAIFRTPPNKGDLRNQSRLFWKDLISGNCENWSPEREGHSDCGEHMSSRTVTWSLVQLWL